MTVKKKYNIEGTLTPKKVCQLIDDGNIADLPLIYPHEDIHGETVSVLGTNTQFTNYKSLSIPKTCILDDSRVFVFFNGILGSYKKLYSLVLTINMDNTISCGNICDVSLNNVNVYANGAVLFDIDKVLIIYCDDYTPHTKRTRVLTIDGTTISLGAENTLGIGSNSGELSTNISLIALSSTKVLCSYFYSGSSPIVCYILTISGYTVSYGTEYIKSVYGADNPNINLKKLSPTRFVMINPSSSDRYPYITIIDVNINTNVVTFSTPVKVNSSRMDNWFDYSVVDSNRVILFYTLSSTSIKSVIIDINDDASVVVGSVFSYGYGTAINYMNTIKLDEEHILLTLKHTGEYNIRGAVITIDDRLLNYGDFTDFGYLNSLYTIAVQFNSTKYLVLGTNETDLFSYVGMVSVPVTSPASNTTGKVLGIAQDTDGNIVLKGVSNGHSNLVVGQKYYYDDSGNLTTEHDVFNPTIYIGNAISSSEIFIQDFIIDELNGAKCHVDKTKIYNIETTTTAHKVCQLLDNGNIDSLPVRYIHDDIHSTSISSVGTPIDGSAKSGNAVLSVKLDDNHVLAVGTYTISDGANLTASVYQINGSTITCTNTKLASANYFFLALDVVDSTHAILSYTGLNNNTFAVLLTINTDGTVAQGTVLQVTNIGNGQADYKGIKMIDSTHAVLVYRWGSTMYAVRLLISGTSLSMGTVNTLSNVTNMAGSFSLVVIDSTHIFMNYYYADGHMYAVFLTINGDTVTSGAPVSICSASQWDFSNIRIDTNKILVNFGQGPKVNSIMIDITGGVITYGNITTLYTSPNSLGALYVTSVKLDSTHVYVAYTDSTVGGSPTYAQILWIDGINSYASTSTNLNIAMTYKSSVMLGAEKVFMSYDGTAGDNYGVLITVPLMSPKEIHNGKAIGITQDTLGSVKLRGLSKGHSNLIVGAEYYYDENGDGSLTTETKTFLTPNKFIGVAISENTLLIPDYL